MNISSELAKVYQSKNFDTNTAIWDYCMEIATKDGAFLEFGVYEGYSINYMSALLPEAQFYGFDSFEGLPEFWREGYDKGTFKIDQKPQVNSNVEIVEGLFQETLPLFAKTLNKLISFCHLDCDLYSSSKYVLDTLSNHFQTGAILLFDEFYNYPGFENGEIKAFLEFVQESGIKYEYIGYNVNHEQVAIRILEL